MPSENLTPDCLSEDGVVTTSEDVIVQSIQPSDTRSADVRCPSATMKRPVKWARSVEKFAQVGQQHLSENLTPQKPWSDDYQRYWHAKKQLSDGVQPGPTNSFAQSTGRQASEFILSEQAIDPPPISKPFICLLCFTRSKKLRGVERHFQRCHPSLKEDQYVSSFIDERNAPRIDQSSPRRTCIHYCRHNGLYSPSSLMFINML